MDEDFYKKDDPMRLKQESCKHYSWKCTCCGLHQDNYKTYEQIYINNIEKKIAEYELILTSLGFSFVPFEKCSCNGIIKVISIKLE